MSLLPTSSKRLESPDAAPQHTTVLRELAAILVSGPFRTSPQCQRLLRYIVEQSLEGHTEALRERVIGMAVFDRRPDYEPGQDPVVRIRAADVRKRLAQYYRSSDPEAIPAVQIDVPPGSYRASFRTDVLPASAEPAPAAVRVAAVEPAALPPAIQAIGAAQAGAEVPPVPGSHGRGVVARAAWIAALLVVAGALATVFWLRSSRTGPVSALDRFWAPFITAPQPVLVCLGANAVYQLSDEYMASYRHAHHIANNGAELFVDLPPGTEVRAADLLPIPNTFVGFADIAASTDVIALLAQRHKAFAQRLSSDLSFPDLRKVPSILVGGFNNRWTLEMTGDLRFQFHNGHTIVDTQTGHVWPQVMDPSGQAVDDYALISRLMESKTGAPLLVIAGIGSSGTQAAGEFVSSRTALAGLARGAPPGWAEHNMQILLHVHVVEYAPSKVEVVAERFW